MSRVEDLSEGACGPDLECPACREPLVGSVERACPDCGYALRDERGVWRDAGLAEPAGFSAATRQHLQAIEGRHFWFAPRDRLLQDLVRRIVPRGGTMLELGAGSGRMVAAWREWFDAVVLVEAHGGMLAGDAAGGGVLKLQADVGRVPFPAASFDALMAFDVLEHVDESLMLGEARRLARPGARLLLSVPASMGLWSYADDLAGHRLRYDRGGLYRALRRHAWRPLGFTHYQFALFPLLWLSRRVLGPGGRRLERQPPAWAGAMLGAVNAAEVALLSGRALPWGSSLLVWAEAT